MSDIVDRLEGVAPSIMAMRDGAKEIRHLRASLERSRELADIKHNLFLQTKTDLLELKIDRAKQSESFELEHLLDELARFQAQIAQQSSDCATKNDIAQELIADKTALKQDKPSFLASNASDPVRDALEEILNYAGGADNALEDPYVMERAHAALSTGGESHE